MDFTEMDLEDIIFNTENNVLKDRGLLIHGKKFRQIKIGNYGIADIISFKRPEYNITTKIHINSPIITVYELKKNIISYDTLDQLIRYMKGIERYIYSFRGKVFDEFYEETGYDILNIRGIMIGKKINMDDSLCYIPNIINEIDIYTYKYKHDGIYFKNENNYKLTEEGFYK